MGLSSDPDFPILVQHQQMPVPVPSPYASRPIQSWSVQRHQQQSERGLGEGRPELRPSFSLPPSVTTISEHSDAPWTLESVVAAT